jgi:hypothetical protein
MFGLPLCHLDQWLLIFYWPKFFFSGQSKADPHFRHCKVFLLYELFIGSMHNLQLLNYFYSNVVKYNQISCIKITNSFFHYSHGGWGDLFKVILVGTGVQLILRKHIAIKWNLYLLVKTFLTTLTPLARVVLRNDASPSDGDNKRLGYILMTIGSGFLFWNQNFCLQIKKKQEKLTVV